MADPATQFQQAGLNAPYQYTPVETRLNPPIQLPSAAPYIAGIGTAANEALQNLKNSPLNPLVRAQMQAEGARYNLERQQIEDVSKDPNLRRLVGVDQGGASIIAPARAGPGFYLGGGTPNRTVVNRGGGDGNAQPPPAAPGANNANANPAAANFVPGFGSVVDALTTNVATVPQSGNQGDQITTKPTSLIPANERNPLDLRALPDVDKYNQTSATQPSRNLFAVGGGQNAPSPDQYLTARTRLPSQGGDLTQMSASTDNQQLLTQWQNTNAHPVAPTIDALNWAKSFDTRAQDATYLPHGGPGGEPAYAFHMKGGGTPNVVPLSQMVQNGFAPVVTGNNTSMALSAADQVRQQGMAPTGQVGGQNQPTIPGAQQLGTAQVGAQPPAAPDQGWSPEASSYLASRVNLPGQGGDLSTLVADSHNDHLLKANADRNQNLAPNTIVDNASGVARSTDPMAHDPVPNGETMGQPNQEALNAGRQAKANNYAGLPPGSNGEGSHLLGYFNGYNWFVDSDPKQPNSGVPYMIFERNPWSERRMYDDGKWDSREVILPDELLNHAIYDINKLNVGEVGKDALNWTKDQKVDFLVQNYTREATHQDQRVTDRLTSLRKQIIDTQRQMDNEVAQNPGQHNIIRQAQQWARSNSSGAEGSPANDFWRGLVRAFSGQDKVDHAYKDFGQNHNAIAAGARDANLFPEEQDELKDLDPVNNPDGYYTNLSRLNSKRIGEYQTAVRQAVTDYVRVNKDFLNSHSQLSKADANGRRTLLDANVGLPPDLSNSPTPAPVPSPSPYGTMGSATNPARPKNPTEYQNLQSGSVFIDLDGVKKRKK